MRCKGPCSRWRASRLPACGGATAFLLVALTHYVALPWYAAYRSPMARPDEVQQLCSETDTPVVCYPRNCDSVAFFLGRDDFRSYRSKQTPVMIQFLLEQPRTVILFTHRHSLEALRQVLPPALL